MLVEHTDVRGSFLHPNLSFPNLFIPSYVNCLASTPSSIVFTSFCFTFFFLFLPLCILVVYAGLQKCLQTGAISSATMHSDSITYHKVTADFIGVIGCLISPCGMFMRDWNVLAIGGFFLSFSWYGGTVFHVLMCAEHYLAVVHPITYLSLRNERGIRIRNISAAFSWLLCFLGIFFELRGDVYMATTAAFSALAVAAVLFCSVSVLKALDRPGPGKQSKRKVKVDQSKQRMFHTIVAILGVLVLRFIGGVFWTVAYVLESRSHECLVMASVGWLNVPSSLVSPLLFLYRAKQVMCWKKK